MRVSVVICTWNRCELLRRTLESLRSIVVPAGVQWELLVVNNDSPDATDEILAAYRDLLPLRRLREPTAGVSRARNTAVGAAQGDLVLFTDDDVRVDAQWMAAYVHAAQRRPDSGYFGGQIHPDFAADVPGWVRRNQSALAGMLCLRDLQSANGILQPHQSPFGPNMAVRRDALALASFDERFGRKGDEQVRGSEATLFDSLRQQGVRGIWVADAKVYHYIPRCRANPRYLWSYYYGCGRTEARLAIVRRARPLRPRRHLLKAGAKAAVKICLQPSRWCKHLATMATIGGEVAERRRLAQAPKSFLATEP